jgi:(1->4)-alpha-D-glucan 1-alpha-D-glucosylmutase
VIGGTVDNAGIGRNGNIAPRATYRLQFNQGFTFRDAAEAVAYLDRLGISHVYASPYLTARPGSPHGYDITDHNALNPELGTAADFEDFVTALHARGMAQILDFVPNHMGIGKADNAWWLDILEWGPASPFANYFDIDWTPAKRELRGKVLLPFLGDHYGAVLEAGELRLAFDAAAGAFSVWYHDHRFPVAPAQYPRILRVAGEAMSGQAGPQPVPADFDDIIKSLDRLRSMGDSERTRAARREQGLALKRDLASLVAREAALRPAIEKALGAFNGQPGNPVSFTALHRLLERQAYRLAYWRVAADEINYRRFFDFNELAGIRIENPVLFGVVHRLVRRLFEEGKLAGLRIDHIDGLFDPEQYCGRLKDLFTDRHEDGSTRSVYLAVEKILAPHERLHADWPVAGTTGYEFLNQMNALFIDSGGERPLTRTYRHFAKSNDGFNEILYAAKQQIMENALTGELQVLTSEIDRIAESHWRTRDFTFNNLRDALREVVAFFRVYRTYVSAAGTRPEDRSEIEYAIAAAKRHNPSIDTSLFEFIEGVLTTDLVRRRPSSFGRRRVIRFAMHFQQFTGPVMARAMEDTAFYRYHRLISLNEVGGDPRRFGLTPGEFHDLNRDRARTSPTAMLTSSTHDTKRGEDVRARINVLSEIPAEWDVHVRRWARINRAKKIAAGNRCALEPNDEYLLYQTLVGAWPNELTGMKASALDREKVRAFSERIADYMIKAIREAKIHSNWNDPNEAYETAGRAFLAAILDTSGTTPFLTSFLPFQAGIARLGAVNSLAQTVLKLTVPGIPDVYQGTEFWDLNLVDPDNRRPVDFPERAESLARFEAGVSPAALLADWRDGRIKHYVVWRLLRLRRRLPALFAGGEYVPIPVEGAKAAHVFAFARTHADTAIVVVVPRLVFGLTVSESLPVLEDTGWNDTALILPPHVSGETFVDVLDGKKSLTVRTSTSARRATVATLFEDIPVSVFAVPSPDSE